jgi:hypothetical protein
MSSNPISPSHLTLPALHLQLHICNSIGAGRMTLKSGLASRELAPFQLSLPALLAVALGR